MSHRDLTEQEAKDVAQLVEAAWFALATLGRYVKNGPTSASIEDRHDLAQAEAESVGRRVAQILTTRNEA